jgi:hypothetical protein
MVRQNEEAPMTSDLRWEFRLGQIVQSSVSEQTRTFFPADCTKGISIRLSTQGKLVTTVAAVNCYVMEIEGERWWLITDLKAIGQKLRRGSFATRSCQKKAVLGAFMACMCSSVATSRILFASTGDTDLSIGAVFEMLQRDGLGLRRLTDDELTDAPLGLRRLVGSGHCELNNSPVVYCLDKNKIADLTKLTRTFFKRTDFVKMNGDVAGRMRWASEANQLLRVIKEKKVTRIELEVGLLDDKAAPGEIGARLLRWTRKNDGICAHVVCKIGAETLKLGRARAYHVDGRANGHGRVDDWWVLGDPELSGMLRDNQLHEKLLAARVLGCLRLDASPDRIIMAPGQYHYKAIGLGLREMHEDELRDAPWAIRQLAAASRRRCSELRSGLFCVDAGQRLRYLRLAREMTEQGTIHWYGLNNSMSTRCGDNWRTIVAQLTQDWVKLVS